MDSRPAMYNNVSSSQLELCLLEYSDEVNDGSCVDWAVVLWPVNVLILNQLLMQAGRSKEEEERDGREEDYAKVNHETIVERCFCHHGQDLLHQKNKNHSCPSRQHVNKSFILSSTISF